MSRILEPGYVEPNYAASFVSARASPMVSDSGAERGYQYCAECQVRFDHGDPDIYRPGRIWLCADCWCKLVQLYRDTFGMP